MSDPAVNRRRSRSWRVFKWLIISVGLIVAVGAAFQFSMTQWESHRYPPPGKLVDIGGLRLHISCTGAGSPTVIMESGVSGAGRDQGSRKERKAGGSGFKQRYGQALASPAAAHR